MLGHKRDIHSEIDEDGCDDEHKHKKHLKEDKKLTLAENGNWGGNAFF